MSILLFFMVLGILFTLISVIVYKKWSNSDLYNVETDYDYEMYLKEKEKENNDK